MKIAKQRQILSHIIRLLNQADKEFVKHVNNKSKLIKELSNELFFMGAFTRSDLDNHVIPFMKENAVEIYTKKEKVLKGETLKDDDLDYITLIKDLGKQIREWREKRHYSQKTLALKAGTTQQVLSRIESGKDLKQPTLELCHRITKAAGLKLVFEVADSRKQRGDRGKAKNNKIEYINP